MLTADTKRRIDSCRDVLVGKLPLPTDQVELITLTLIYKFMDDLDEGSVALGGRRSFFVNGLARYRWRALMPQTVSADERMNLFAAGLEALGGSRKDAAKDPAAHLPGLFRDVFRNSFLKFRDGRILTLFLNEINGFEYSHSEELGNAFEYLLQCMGTQGENGQFRTPRHIIDFMVACLDPKPTDRILDPACGTGGFLVSSFKHILAAHTSKGASSPGDKLSHDQRQRVYKNLTGYDITDLMVKLSKVNLFLHGFPDPAIHIYDTLSNDARWNEKADLILANPPFMTPKGGVTPHAKFRVAAKKAEVLFTDYIAEHLTSEGRGGVIVPNGIVATTQNAYVQLRKFLVEDSLVAVVSLPAGVFKPYSGVKTSILFLDKALARKTDKILFLKVTADGFDLGDQRRQIEANDLPEAQRVVKAWLSSSLGKFASTISFRLAEKADLLMAKGVSLNAERYADGTSAIADVVTVRLGDVCEKCLQVSPKALGRSVIRYIDIDSIDNDALRIREPKILDVNDAPSRARKLVKTGDVLFSTVRPYLRNIAVVSANLEGEIASTGFGVIRADQSHSLPEYLFAVVSDQRFVDKANTQTNGASYPAITESQLFDIEIPLPPLEEQRRIVEEIEGYQKIIDGARQILAAYRPRLDINPDWPTKPLDEICQFIDYRGKTPEKSASGIPLITAKNVRFGFISTEPAEFVREKTYDAWMTRGFPKKGDVVITTEAPLGMAALINHSERFALAQRTICLSPNPKILTGGYLCRAILCEQIQKSLEANATGSTVLGIKASSLKEIKIPLPPLDEQRCIVAELDDEAAQIEAVRALIPRYEAKIQRILDRVWCNNTRGD